MSGMTTATLEVTPHQSEAEPPAGCDADRRRFTVAALVGLVVAAIPFVWVLWDGGLDPLRTALPDGLTSNFYDLQARALFHGHWWVPKGSLVIEAFVIHGRDYMYFPPFPALLRMPVLAFTNSLDGKLTAPSMLLAWLVTALFVPLLVWRVRMLVRGPAALGRAEAASVAALIATIMSGSVLLYLAALPWVYHEDFAWGVAFAVGALFALLGVLERPSARRVAATGALTLGAALSRTTIGWGCVIAVVLAATWLALGRGGPDHRRWWPPVLAAGVLPLAIGSAINVIKFGTPFLPPNTVQVFTKLSQHRRQVLAANGGRLFNLHFVPSTVWAYLRPTGLRLTSVFPFLTLPAIPARGVGGVILDQTYRTASVPASMPLLFVLGIWGVVTAFRPHPVGRARLTRIPLIGAAAATAGVFVSAYISPRYLAEFLTLLILASVIGLVDLWRRADTRSRPFRIGVLTAMTGLALFGMAANVAVATTAERLSAGTDQVRGYVQLQKSISDITGHPLNRNVMHGEQLPWWAPADQLFIMGECDGLYVSTGEYENTWVTAELKETEADATLHRPLSGRPISLITIGDGPSETLSIEGNAEGRIRFRVDTPRTRSKWVRVPFNRTNRVTLAEDYAARPLFPGTHLFLVGLNGQKAFEWWGTVSGRPVVHQLSQDPGSPPLPLTVTEQKPVPTLCRSLSGAPRAMRARRGHRSD